MRDETPRKILQKLTSPAMRSPVVSPPANSKEQKAETQGIIKSFLQPTPEKSQSKIHSLHRAILDNPLFRESGASIENQVLTLKSFSTPEKAVIKPTSAESKKPHSQNATAAAANRTTSSPSNPSTPLQIDVPPPIVRRLLSPSLPPSTPTQPPYVPMTAISSPSPNKPQAQARNIILTSFPDAMVRRPASSASPLPYKRDFISTVLEVLNYLVFFGILFTLFLLLYLVFITTPWENVIGKGWRIEWVGGLDEFQQLGSDALIGMKEESRRLALQAQGVLVNLNPLLEEFTHKVVVLWKRLDRDLTNWAIGAWVQFKDLAGIR